MRALRWHGKHDIRCEHAPDPRIEAPRDAIVRVTSCAICGSDLHLYNALVPGMMVEVGPGNRSLKVGNPVLVPGALVVAALMGCGPRERPPVPVAPPATATGAEQQTTASTNPAPVPGKGTDVTEHRPESGMIGGASGTVASGGKPGSGTNPGAGTGPSRAGGNTMPPPR